MLRLPLQHPQGKRVPVPKVPHPFLAGTARCPTAVCGAVLAGGRGRSADLEVSTHRLWRQMGRPARRSSEVARTFEVQVAQLAVPDAGWFIRFVGARYGVPKGLPWHAPTTASRQGTATDFGTRIRTSPSFALRKKWTDAGKLSEKSRNLRLVKILFPTRRKLLAYCACHLIADWFILVR